MGKVKQSIIDEPHGQDLYPEPEDYALLQLHGAVNDIETYVPFGGVDELEELRDRLDAVIREIKEA